jgi:hypothetical protein
MSSEVIVNIGELTVDAEHRKYTHFPSNSKLKNILGIFILCMIYEVSVKLTLPLIATTNSGKTRKKILKTMEIETVESEKVLYRSCIEKRHF